MKIVKIGRKSDNDVALEDDLAVSGEHAEIFQDDEGNVFLTDLNSTNGTFVNGKQIDGSIILNFNDIVKVGNQVLPWRNFLEAEDLDATIAKQIIIEQEIEELKTPISYSKKNFLWIPISLIILFIVGMVLFNNSAEEKEERKDPSGTYTGWENDIEYKFIFSNDNYEKTVTIVERDYCYYTGNWSTQRDGDIRIYNLIGNIENNCDNNYYLEGTYEVCDKPECITDGKYYKKNNLNIWPQ